MGLIHISKMIKIGLLILGARQNNSAIRLIWVCVSGLRTNFPYGTLIVNLSGCFMVGLLGVAFRK